LSAEWLAGVKRNAIEIERSEAVRLITNAATTKARHQSAVASCTLLTATHHIMRVTGKGSKRDQEETDAVIKRDSKRVLKMCLAYTTPEAAAAPAPPSPVTAAAPVEGRNKNAVPDFGNAPMAAAAPPPPRKLRKEPAQLVAWREAKASAALSSHQVDKL
jgi:hypothetical protein